MSNENREVAIRLSGVKKKYKLGQIGGGTLTADLQSWWARVRGKEDPNSMIGTDQRLIGQTFMALNGIDLTAMVVTLTVPCRSPRRVRLSLSPSGMTSVCSIL